RRARSAASPDRARAWSTTRGATPAEEVLPRQASAAARRVAREAGERRAPRASRRIASQRLIASARTSDDPEPFVRAQLRHNLAALGADFGLFMIGMSFASQTTILPAFGVYLGAPNVVIGAIPAVM